MKRTILGAVVGLFVLTSVGAYVWHKRDELPDNIPDMLIAISKKRDPNKNSFMNTERAAIFGSRLRSDGDHMDPNQLVDVELTYARELTNAGKTEEAIKEFELIEKQHAENLPVTWDKAWPILLRRKAIAYLRLGEEQNCCAVNNARSCLVPISGAGIHTRQEGSRNAIKVLNEALKLNPEDTGARWLLNIAYMTLGKYPKGVPAKWLIPINTFGGECGAMSKFYNAAPDLGLDFLGWAGGAAFEDFDGDGLLDLMISSMRVDGQLRYFHSNGDGTFAERTKEAGLIGELGGLNFITTDYNNDGRPDVVVLRGGWVEKGGHYPLSLLRNDGGGHFTDVTIKAGLLTFGPCQSAAPFDYNGDGLLDLFLGKESTKGDDVPCQLYRNNGDGTFTDVTEECGINIKRYVKGVIAADFMHTGRPGLYLSCCGQQNVLLRNDGPAGSDKSPKAPWKFTDISRTAGVDKQLRSFSCFFFDYDNDGWPDIYVGGFGTVPQVGLIANDYLGLPTSAEKARLYRNNHDGTFTDVSRETHLNKVIHGMGINFGDLDNDGWLDFYVGTGNPDLGVLIPKRMFHNHEGKYFEEVTTTGDFGHLQKGHAVSFADIRNNGQQDIFIKLGGAYDTDTAHSCLFVNPGSKNHWIGFQLVGTKSNRVGIGAEISVTVVTPRGDRKIYRTAGEGGSFGVNSFRQEIGLGDATAIKELAIRWPASGIQQTVTGLKMDAFFKIHEGATAAEPWKLPTFQYKLHHESITSHPGGKVASAR